MATRMPIIKQTAIMSLFVQIALLAALAFVLRSFGSKDYLYYSVVLFVAIFYSLRYGIAKDHRKGMGYYRHKNYEAAIASFSESLAFFRRHAYLDRYRYLFLLSSSAISYTEMAMINIAFCHSQIGNKDMAIKTYQEVLELFPNSEIAKSSLKMLC